MASLAVASTAALTASASSLSGVRLAGAQRAGPSSVKVAGIRCQAKTENGEVMKERRAVVTGAAALGLMALIAVDESVPKNGSEEAKKKYSRICITMPTASVCDSRK